MKAISLYLYSIIIFVYFLGCSNTNSSKKIDQETSHISLQNEKKL
ncbi:hypothetical protein DI53_3757 [Sphingobacterium deserti]|uniref:Uncharacterized protein n=1 Tax=Sphingobacterium deserti TaxID=1229276 RepID=A0A0B8SYP8_9SPHI|nr:hypothetical protein DI53_3757 [Sphingobacterium deserti]